jgi:hypothetical protein
MYIVIRDQNHPACCVDNAYTAAIKINAITTAAGLGQLIPLNAVKMGPVTAEDFRTLTLLAPMLRLDLCDGRPDGVDYVKTFGHDREIAGRTVPEELIEIAARAATGNYHGATVLINNSPPWASKNSAEDIVGIELVIESQHWDGENESVTTETFCWRMHTTNWEHQIIRMLFKEAGAAMLKEAFTDNAIS